MAGESARPVRASAPNGAGRARYIFRVPPPATVAGLLVVAVGAAAAIAWLPAGYPEPFVEGLVLVFAIPAAAAALLTPPLARALGGAMLYRRSLFLALTGTVVMGSLLALERLLDLVPAFAHVAPATQILFVVGPLLWVRHMSLFGISRPSHARSLPASILPPLLVVVGVGVLYGFGAGLVEGAATFFLLGFAASLLLLRAADRPLRREFGISGVSLIRPLLDHVNERDPGATATIESFFGRFALPADLRLTIVAFDAGGSTKATIVLPTVHPGPFAALGASDLPRKMGEALGPRAGTVFVPHTPCNHDLDLPTSREVDRVGAAAKALFAGLPSPGPARASPLVEGRPGGLARAQTLGDVTLLFVSRAPEPTDDIDFSVADQLHRESAPGRVLAVVDAHNSYVEGEGDIVYGTPAATTLLSDGAAAIAAAARATVPGTIEVGRAVTDGYSIGTQGIGPHGIRVLAIRAAGTTTAYVLIDGNNLVRGLRARVLAPLGDLVGAAEVMTTDNHVVHEVDGGINPVGERYPIHRLAADVRSTVERAVADLTPVSVRAGEVGIPSVPVLGPGWTARLLTSLGDTVSAFTNALLMSFLLLLASSAVALLVVG
ncbi:MAG TPA: DUF2070 family protein [Thermoplasmata archaeon]|nr:DUF2070 family protein [Thermoplasmata archaeon]